MSGALVVLGGFLLAAWMPPLAVVPDTFSPEAEIMVERQPLADGGEQVTARAVYTGTETGLMYRFTTHLEGSAGRSRSVQSGEVGPENTLATSSVRLGSGATFTAHLELLRGDKTVGEARWSSAGR